MHEINFDNLPPPTKKTLQKLSAALFIKRFYLAGGTALALYFRHRESNDLDFFSDKPFSSAAVIQNLKKLGSVAKMRISENTIIGYFDKVKISFFSLSYGLIYKPAHYQHLRVAMPNEIGAMKILAISDRGKKRDFIDLYHLAINTRPLDELFWDFQKKFGKYDYNIHHIIKSLAYFEDADKDEMPKMYIDLDWKTVKQFFLREKPHLAKKFLIG